MIHDHFDDTHDDVMESVHSKNVSTDAVEPKQLEPQYISWIPWVLDFYQIL